LVCIWFNFFAILVQPTRLAHFVGSAVPVTNPSSVAVLSPQSRRLVYCALYTSVFAFSLSFGGLVPWLALALEARGTEPTVIGIVSAANPVGVLVAASFVPRLLTRFGASAAMVVGVLTGAVSILALYAFDSIASWIVLRFISGVAGSIPWVITETWINIIADDRSRGRAIAGYAAVMAAGFACGPLIVTTVGFEGALPLIVFTLLKISAIVPILLIWNLSPTIERSGATGITAMLKAMPLLLAAAFLAGAADTAFFSFLPIWGLRIGLDDATAVTLLSLFVIGNVVLQFPIGWLGDKTDYRLVLTGCGAICAAGPVLAYVCPPSPYLLGVILFFWGGAAWGVYSVSLAALGKRFTGTLLAAANAAFVIIYTVANITGPPVAGLALSLWNPHGLLAFMFAMAAAFLALALFRLIANRGT
jgi:MFS family permease